MIYCLNVLLRIIAILGWTKTLLRVFYEDKKCLFFLKDIKGHIFNVRNPAPPHPVTDLADLFKSLSSYVPFYHCDAGLLVIFGVI